MNYRHAFHAGGFADTMKHAILVALLLHLRKKETPFCVLDTHAGTGRYDLTGGEAIRTGEAQSGVLRLASAARGGTESPALDAYLELLRALNPDWPTLRTYPGSPLIARRLMRPRDRLVAVELHPEDARALQSVFAHDRQVSVQEYDGYRALKAHLPPKERRGLVLIDPPFEEPDELRRIARALPEALKRWRTGIFAIWYPIKATAAAQQFRDEIAALGVAALAAELYRFPPDEAERLSGSGVAILNPPWKLDETLGTLLGILAKHLGALGGARIVELAAGKAL